MRVQVAGRHVDVGEALKSRIADDLTTHIEKYFQRSGEATVTVAREGVGFEVDCTLHLPSGILLQAEGRGGDAHSAFTDALDKIGKRVQRYKRRLKNHHNTQKTPLPAENAPSFVLQSLQASDSEDDSDDVNGFDGVNYAPEEGEAPLIIAETIVAVKTMTVSMAVMQLDLSEAPVLLFRNAAHGGLSLVYRRADGNVGWVDPERPQDQETERPNAAALTLGARGGGRGVAMNDLSDLIMPTAVAPRIAAPTRKLALQSLADIVARAASLDPKRVLNSVLMRERLAGTGVGEGVAIPHAMIEGLTQPVGGFGRLDPGADFAALDGRPADLVFMLLTPKGGGQHLKTLARISRFLRRAEIRGQLRGARTADELYSVFCVGVKSDAA